MRGFTRLSAATVCLFLMAGSALAQADAASKTAPMSGLSDAAYIAKGLTGAPACVAKSASL